MDADVVVLAAGRASRVGTPKALVSVQDVPWIERQLERLAECGARRVLVVFGHAWEAHLAALGWAARAAEAPLPMLGTVVEVVRNDAPERGPFSSLQTGLARVAEGQAAFVLPVDVPCPGRPVWRALADAVERGAEAAIPTRDARGGHPVLLSSALAAKLRAAPADARLDVELRACGERVARVEVDDGRVLANLNAPEDWEAIAGGDADDR